MNFLSDLFQQIQGASLISLPNIIRALRYTRYRDRQERRFPLPPVPAEPCPAGRLLSAEPRPGGALFRFEAAALTVRFLAPDMAFTAWDGSEMAPSFAVAREEWTDAPANLERTDDGWRLRSAGIDLLVPDTGALRWRDAQGRPLREEQPPVRAGRLWTQTARLDAGECVYGLGGRTTPLNRRQAASTAAGRGAAGAPVVYRFWNTDPGGAYRPGADPLYITMPVYVCLRDSGAILVFHDNTFDGSISLGDELAVRFSDGPRRTYLITGSPASIISRFTELTGRAPLPPRWALGYHHSRWGFATEREVRRVFNGFREHGLPLGVLHLDIDHMRGFRILTTDEKRFPRLAALAEELHAAGTRLVAIVDPGIKRDRKLDLYKKALSNDALCKLPDGSVFRGVVWPGSTVFPDFTRPDARAWWGGQYQGELSRGIDGFWHDMNEPACFTAWGPPTFPLCVRHDMEGRGGDHREAHNVYGMMMNRAGLEGLRTLRPGNRPFIVSRSGWVGMQRWSWSWTGDVETSWRALRGTPALVLGLGLCGMPYAGPDIGGFSGAPTPELYVRWFQLGSFMPFFRTHCAIHLPHREPWSFGPDVLEIARKSLEMRRRLLPHLYTQAWQVSQTGLPFLRPVFWSEPDRRELREIDDEFLLGDDLLVAPVLEEGARARTVVLPGGAWYALEGPARHTGPSTITVDAPLDTAPVFARGGSIVALREGDGMRLHAFRAADGGSCTCILFDDDGDGYGNRRLDLFSLAPSPRGGPPRLSWTTEGAYPWRHGAVTLVLHGFEETRVEVAGPTPAPVTVAQGGAPGQARK